MARKPKEKKWEPPEKSDQPPGEETVQVNDAYVGGQPPPETEANVEEQHPHGG